MATGHLAAKLGLYSELGVSSRAPEVLCKEQKRPYIDVRKVDAIESR